MSNKEWRWGGTLEEITNGLKILDQLQPFDLVEAQVIVYIFMAWQLCH